MPLDLVLLAAILASCVLAYTHRFAYTLGQRDEARWWAKQLGVRKGTPDA